MTNKKASKILGVMDFDLVSLHGPIEKVIEYSKACSMGADALKKADKYKVHNLRKNPTDLPKENSFITVTDGIRVYSGQVFRRDAGLVIKTTLYRQNNYEVSNEEYISESDLIAWRHTEPFEVK